MQLNLETKIHEIFSELTSLLESQDEDCEWVDYHMETPGGEIILHAGPWEDIKLALGVRKEFEFVWAHSAIPRYPTSIDRVASVRVLLKSYSKNYSKSKDAIPF